MRSTGLWRVLGVWGSALVLGAIFGILAFGLPSARADSPDGDTALSTEADAIDPGPDTDPSPADPLPDDVIADVCPMDAECRPIASPTATATTLDRAAIVNYAVTYVGDTVNSTSSFGYNPHYVHFRNDCQNFVSQALRAGGWPDDHGSPSWFYVPPPGLDYSGSWVFVSSFWRYGQQHPGRGKYVKYWSEADVGDPVLVDWNGNTDGVVKPTHSMIITQITGTPGKPNFQVYFTYHTNNRLNRTKSSLKSSFPHVLFWAYHVSATF